MCHTDKCIVTLYTQPVIRKEHDHNLLQLNAMRLTLKSFVLPTQMHDCT